jgi:hypothetical protein
MPDWLKWLSVGIIWAWFAAAALYESSRGLRTIRRRRRPLNPLSNARNISITSTKAKLGMRFGAAALLLVLGLASIRELDFTLSLVGVLLVIIGVVGENMWDDKTSPGMAKMYKFSAGVLVFGLAVEIVEAVHSARENLELTEDVAAAQEKARLADERAAKAEIELEKIKQANKPRNISVELQREFIAALKDSPKGVVHVALASLSGDIPIIAYQVSGMIESAGFDHGDKKVVPQVAIYPPHPWYIGILVNENEAPPAHAGTIQKAFKSIGIDAPSMPNKVAKSGEVVIFVGEKRGFGFK